MMHTKISSILITVSLVLALALPSGKQANAQTIQDAGCRIYVGGPSAHLGGNGSSWANAMPDLADAIQAADFARGGYENPCDIWVATGTYQPKNSGGYFNWTDFINIYGGFSGSEINLSDRDWRTHTTVLTGNGSSVVRANLVYHATLDGFTITGGNANGNAQASEGGGMYIGCGSPYLVNLTITGNSAATYGGGLFINSSGCTFAGSPSILNIIISGNTAGTAGGGIAQLGGGFALLNGVFYGNSAPVGDGIYNQQSSASITNASMYGNGIYNYSNSKPGIQNTIIWNGGSSSGITNVDTTYDKPVISYSMVDGCNPSGVWTSYCGTNLSDANPDFVGNAPVNLHLQGASPVINKGNIGYLSGYTKDLDGNPRIVGTGVDLGAYEYHAINTPPVISSFNKTGLSGHNLYFSSTDFIAHFTDADHDALTSIKISSLPEFGALYLADSAVTLNQVILAGDLAGLHFKCPSNWSGTTSFDWTASDGQVFATDGAKVNLSVAIAMYLPFISH